MATVVATVVKSEPKLTSSDSGQSSLWERASLSLERGNEIDHLKGLLKYPRAVRLCPFSGSRKESSSLSPCMDGTSDGPLWVTLLPMAQAHEWPSVKNQQQVLLFGGHLGAEPRAWLFVHIISEQQWRNIKSSG